MRVFFSRFFLLLLCLGSFGLGNARIAFADELTFTEAFFARQEQYSGMVEVPGKGPMRYYAQNDPLWGALAYENPNTKGRRPFRDGGCGPTACAMAIANLVPAAELSRILADARQDFSLCPCSLNSAKCNQHHARYLLTSQRDYLRFLPLIFGDYAAGNNLENNISRTEAQGTGSGFMHGIAKAYGIQLTATNDYAEALRALRGGDTVVAHASRGGAFTNTGHYVLLAHVDEERLYILDPLCREVYKTNQSSKIEILQPGLVALRHENFQAASIGMFMIFHRE